MRKSIVFMPINRWRDFRWESEIYFRVSMYRNQFLPVFGGKSANILGTFEVNYERTFSESTVKFGS